MLTIYVEILSLTIYAYLRFALKINKIALFICNYVSV